MKDMSVLMWFYCGGVGYEFLSKNSQGTIPSSSTLARTKKSELETFPLGISLHNIQQAKKFFQSCDYKSMMFSLSEDATSIIPGIQWYEKDDSLVGIITKNGEYSVPVENFNQVLETFKNSSCAVDVRVYLLNPLDILLPSYILAIYPSDKKENAEGLIQRWNEMSDLCQKNSIIIINHGMDGEPKQLAAMLKHYSTSSKYFEFLSPHFKGIRIKINKIGNVFFPECFFQDFIHIGTKLRNNLISALRKLILGGHSITLETLRQLLSRLRLN